MEIKVLEKVAEFFEEKDEVDLAYLFGSTSRGIRGNWAILTLEFYYGSPWKNRGCYSFN
ncbi:hypothetical protein [Methanothermobacter thermautotrophicus]|uniref:hypothetical protein n=1 Tax=Methanothermobacter thermautotrophicus TaxID=145262 RepID=UPI0022B9C5B6|nr:hypothetical protein [Methanothermobacter thermautotrophicus]MDI6817736.1 hypothetical protein [Methanothermobacter thermautotrophicus]